MALQPRVNPYLRKLVSKSSNARTFAAAAQASKKSGTAYDDHLTPREEMKVSQVGGMTVASVETNRPLAKIAVFIRAGSRFETDSTQGVSQMLRICAGLGTEHFTQFSTIRHVEFNGGNLTCTTGREYVAYALEASRDKIGHLEKFVKELACFQVFKPWELKDNINRLRLERTIRPPQVRLVELLHKSAFRRGLGYSLYSPKWMIGNHTSEMLSSFVKQNFVEATLVGTGVDHNELRVFAEKFKLPGGGSRKVQASKFHPGSELRKETAADMAYVGLAIEGAAYTNPKEMVAAALVQRALGAGSRVTHGSGEGKIAALSTDKACAKAFSSNYADSGLLGVCIAATPCSVEGVTKKSAEALLTGRFTDADVARAKASLKADVAFATESDDGLLREIGLQCLLTGSIATPADVDALIDSVTAQDMQALVGKGKLSMAAFGKIANVPHIDQLKK